MKKAKKIFKVLSIIIVVFYSLCIAFTWFFGEEIEGIILSKVNSKLKNDISIDNIDFSLVSNFPSASVTLSNILILDSQPENLDSLLFSKEAVIKLNIFDIITKNFSISDISFKQGNIKIRHTKEGNTNFDIFRSTESNNKLNIENIELDNCNLLYENSNEGNKFKFIISIADISLYINENQKKIELNTKMYSENLIIDSLEYLNNRDVKIDANINLTNDSILINAKYVKINTSKFEDIKYISNNDFWKLDCNISHNNISEIIEASPTRFQDIFTGHELGGGIKASIHLLKEKDFSNPFCSINFTLNNSKYKSKTKLIELNKINSEGQFNNGKNRNFSSSKFRFTDFSASKNEGVLNGNFTVSNLNKYYLNADIFSTWTLSELNALMDSSNFRNIKGSVAGDINYNGYLSFDEKMKEYINTSSHTANLDFNNIYFNYKNSPLEFSSENMSWEIENNKVNIKEDKLTVSETDLTFTGHIQDLILYLLNQKEKISIKGQVYSDNMNFEELFMITEMNEEYETETFSTVLPKWFESELEVIVKSFWYSNFNAQNLKGLIIYDSEKLELTCEKLEMQTLNGRITSNFKYFENKIHDLVLKLNLKANKINISDGFNSFNNFGQEFITKKNIKGVASSNMYIQAMWDKDFKFYTPSLNVNAQIKIDDGELIEFEPMYNLSNFISVSELKNVKFATLENKIRIENEKIIIPEMDINSTALSVHVSGSHNFKNIMDYKVRLLLSDVLGNKVKESKSIDLDDINKNKEGKTTIQVRMKGHVDNPKIYLDKLKIKEDVFEEIKKETQEIKNLIQEKILNKTKDNEIPEWVEEDAGIEIDWSDEK